VTCISPSGGFLIHFVSLCMLAGSGLYVLNVKKRAGAGLCVVVYAIYGLVSIPGFYLFGFFPCFFFFFSMSKIRYLYYHLFSSLITYKSIRPMKWSHWSIPVWNACRCLFVLHSQSSHTSDCPRPKGHKRHKENQREKEKAKKKRKELKIGSQQKQKA